MIRWSVLMILSIASVCCLAATTADDKDKAADAAESKTEKAESKDSEDAKPEAGEKKAAIKRDKGKDKEEAAVGKKEEPGDKDKFTAKCPVSGEAAIKEQFTSYKEKEVYFCCDKCKATFEAEPTKFEVKANHQLVQTKQFRQKKCPISGAGTKREFQARVANVTVRFCCEKCEGAVQSAEADAKLEMIFSEEAFKKAFVAVKKEVSEDTDAKLENEGKAAEEKTDPPKEEAEKKVEAK